MTEQAHGLQIVPKEPDRRMEEAAYTSYGKTLYASFGDGPEYYGWRPRGVSVFQAVLAASPNPLAEEQNDD